MALSKYIVKLGKQLKIDESKYDDSNKITPKIIVGNYRSAKSKAFFEKNKIKAVLNCTKDLPNSFRCKSDIEYLRIPVDDSLKDIDIKKMYDFLPMITQFIYKHADIQKNNILVHCVEGSQRSVTAVVCYLMETRSLDPYAASSLVLKKRHKAFHHGYNANFEKAILSYHKKLANKK